MKPLQTLISLATFPAIVLSAFLVAQWGVGMGIAPVLLVSAILVAAAALLLLLQRLHPAVPRWRFWAREAAIDIAHSWVSSLGATVAARAVVLGGVVGLAGLLADGGWQPWPDAWPLWLQLPLALAISDLGAYWIHRASHAWEPLWRLHALHHSSEQLYVLSSGRNHPVHTALSWTVEVVPLLLLGAEPQLLTVHAAVAGAVGLLQHSNVAMKHGFLSYVFATADLHRWHHSAIEAESKTNYGNNLAVWDHLFGSFHLPKDRAAPAAVGIGGMHFPRHLLLQLLSPVMLHRFADEFSDEGSDGRKDAREASTLGRSRS